MLKLNTLTFKDKFLIITRGNVTDFLSEDYYKHFLTKWKRTGKEEH